ncbi:MAG: hypothetical protein VYB72_10700, partial [Planctomycetota bacterium]|nr:hypothetical protein [Planctomycetota bacterium]
RDFYQGFVRKDADEKRIKRLSYFVTILVGVLAMLFVIDPPKYLQDLIVFATGGLAACFLVPLTLSLYWRRMTSAAAISGMFGGTLTHVGLTAWGYWQLGEFRAFEFLGMNPFIWDLFGSAITCMIVVAVGPKPNKKLVDLYFDRTA